MYLFRLVYYSKNVIQAEKRSIFKEIKNILDVSSKNNQKHGITGALLFNQNYFSQVLEGDRRDVTECFCRIANDPRHSDLTMLEASNIDQRVFMNWSIVFAGHSDAAEELYRRYSTTNTFDPTKMSPYSLTEFIRELNESESATQKPVAVKQAG